MKKTLILFIASSLILFCPNTCLANNTINTRHSYNHSYNLNTARKDDIRYQYKKVNGETYRRLYNFTTKTPVTNWEKIS